MIAAAGSNVGMKSISTTQTGATGLNETEASSSNTDADMGKDEKSQSSLMSPKNEQEHRANRATLSIVAYSLKQILLTPILGLPKIEKVTESALNDVLVVLTRFKKLMAQERVTLDQSAEQFIMIMLEGTLDAHSRECWFFASREHEPVIEVFVNFLMTRLENVKATTPFKIPKLPNQTPSPTAKTLAVAVASAMTSKDAKKIRKRSRSNSSARSAAGPSKTIDCYYCGKPKHEIMQCLDFQQDDKADREANLFRKKICIICLRPHHGVPCKKADQKCSVCHKPHSPYLYHRAIGTKKKVQQ